MSSFSFCSNKSLSRSSMSLWSNHIIRLREATSPFWIAKETPLSLWEKENNERWNFTDKISYNSIIYKALPGGGGGPMSPINFKTSCVSVFIKMFVAYCRRCRHCCNLAEGGCLLSQFHFTCYQYFLGHVACRNLPWQGLLYHSVVV